MRIDLNLKYRNSWKQFAQDIKRAQAILHEPFSINDYYFFNYFNPFNLFNV